MKIIVAASQSRFLDPLAPAIRLLAAAGHRVHLIADAEGMAPSTLPRARVQHVVRSAERLQGEYPDRITCELAPPQWEGPWHSLAQPLRRTLDALRYLDRRYDHSPSLRHRAISYAPSLVGRLARLRLFGPQLTRALSAIVRQLERAIPYHPSVEQLLTREAPDALVVTPLVTFASSQVDYVRAARKLGIPSALAVGTWDYLTTKGAMYEQPDRVFVWNAAQRAEAHELCDMPLDRIVVTGAPGYDEWLRQKPGRSRAEFCARVGFDDHRPFLLYVCSSVFITPYEVGFVRRWIDAIRRSDGELARTACLIRPYSSHRSQWIDFDVPDAGAVRVWPPARATPQDYSAAGDYYDAIFHSAAVVGVNTTALVDAGVVGRPVCTPLCDEFAGQQEFTFHFQHVKRMNGGLVQVATTLEQHLEHLADAVRRRTVARTLETRAFTEALLRPNGVDMPVAPFVAKAVETLGSLRVPPSAEPWPNRALRPFLHGAAAMLSRPLRSTARR